VNLNSASVPQLMTLKGMTSSIALAIVKHRSMNGPFRDLFDLADVPKLGRKTFRNITGMVYNEHRINRREKLAHLLAMPASRLGHLPGLAEGVCSRSGFAGCVISDKDGMLLAQSGATAYADVLSAVVPRILLQVRENMRDLAPQGINHTSVCVEDRMFTIVSSGDVFLTAVHEANKITKTQFEFVQKVAAELEWLLSQRGYVGPVEPGTT
jgi:hypothetical protein